MGLSVEKANSGFSEEDGEEQRISSQLVDLRGKLMDMVKSLEIPELKGDTFSRTSKLDFIDKHSRTLQELYTKVTGMTRGACHCSHILRETFYGFSLLSLRSVHNDLSARLQDLESEEDEMTEEEKKKIEKPSIVPKRQEKSNYAAGETLDTTFLSGMLSRKKIICVKLLHSVRYFKCLDIHC